MPLSEVQGSFSTGRDCQIVIQHPLAPGGQVQIPNVTSFQSKQMTTAIKSRLLNGTRLAVHLPDGWELSFSADRGSQGVDDLFVLIEQSWLVAGQYMFATVYQYVTEVDGSVSTYQYTNVSLHLDQGGEWKGDDVVKQTIAGEAYRRNKL